MWFESDVSELQSRPIFLDSLTIEYETDSADTSVLNHLTPRDSPEDGIIQLNRGESLRSSTSARALNLYLKKLSYFLASVTKWPAANTKKVFGH